MRVARPGKGRETVRTEAVGQRAQAECHCYPDKVPVFAKPGQTTSERGASIDQECFTQV